MVQYTCIALHVQYTCIVYKSAYQKTYSKDTILLADLCRKKKAPGLDKVPVRVIKDSLSAILPSITSIINATFQSSTFPAGKFLK